MGEPTGVATEVGGDQDQREWLELIAAEEAAEDLAPKNINCDCTAASRDPDCDYHYLAATDVCMPGSDDLESLDSFTIYGGASITNGSASYELTLDCAIGTYFYETVGYAPDDVKAVMMYARNEYDGAVDLSVSLYSLGMQDYGLTSEDSCTLTSSGATIQACEMDGFSISYLDPLLVAYVELPRTDPSSGDPSMLRGFRVCMNPP